ncbi:MAG: ABC transporter substrate-binding protein [Spirochaetia bacterium]
MKRRLWWLVAVAGILVLAGCGAPKPVSITFWTSHTPPDSDTLKAMVDTWNKANPTIQAQFVQVPGSETDVAKLMTAVRGGTGPDVYFLDRFTVAQRAAAGVLTDLTDLVKKADPAMSSKYVDYAWGETQYKGKTFALPFDTDSRVLFYNKDMIKAAGYDPAMFDSSKGPLTLDEVQKIAFKINKTDKNGAYTQVGFIPYDTVGEQGWHYTWGFAFGGKFADPSTGKVTPADEKIVASFQFLHDWAKAMGPQKVQTFISTYSPPNYPPQQDPFLIGKIAMMINGDWMLNQIRQYAPNLNYGVTYIPVPNKGDAPSTWAGGWSLCIPTGSKHVAEAFKFLTWMTGPDGQKAYTVGTTHLPTWKALLDDNSIFDPQHMFFKQLLANAYSRPPLSVGALYWDALTQAMNAVTLNQEDPKKALQAVADQVNPQIQ